MKIGRFENLCDEVIEGFNKQFGKSGEDIFYRCQDINANDIPAIIAFVEKEAKITPTATQICFLHHFIPAADYLEEVCKCLECAMGAIEPGEEAQNAAYLKIVHEDFESQNSAPVRSEKKENPS